MPGKMKVTCWINVINCDWSIYFNGTLRIYVPLDLKINYFSINNGIERCDDEVPIYVV